MVYTTDTTPRGLEIANKNMANRLADDDVFAHRWLCHPEHECEDGCDVEAIPSRLELYQQASS